MSSRPELRIDWATAEAARYACEKWHYSQSVPVGKTVRIGAWEDAQFVGVVLFAWGMNRNLGSPYGLQMTECCELVRVAMKKHKTEVSRVVAIALRFLKKHSPGLRLVVSFADPEAGHHGGIYQAGNWLYAGRTAQGFEWRVGERRLNKRAYTGIQFGKAGSVAEVPSNARKVITRGKYRYLMPLDDAMRKQIEPLRKPYPKRERSADSGTPGNQPGGGGANPTRSLSTPDRTKGGEG
jgi:hypothetical protein